MAGPESGLIIFAVSSIGKRTSVVETTEVVVVVVLVVVVVRLSTLPVARDNVLIRITRDQLQKNPSRGGWSEERC